MKSFKIKTASSEFEKTRRLVKQSFPYAVAIERMDLVKVTGVNQELVDVTILLMINDIDISVTEKVLQEKFKGVWSR